MKTHPWSYNKKLNPRKYKITGLKTLGKIKKKKKKRETHNCTGKVFSKETIERQLRGEY